MNHKDAKLKEARGKVMRISTKIIWKYDLSFLFYRDTFSLSSHTHTFSVDTYFWSREKVYYRTLILTYTYFEEFFFYKTAYTKRYCVYKKSSLWINKLKKTRMLL